ncbi:hypothetical protein BGZ96_009760 [Linnemannia gamsii]|uniref:Crinkler effector protein N-terminal domain-containing protein n=1 Tax=Linnemannia gamsii TaxID=64522 RepID=A0ABQ7JVL7_9FUNG|nr:hypothetical protein BGZ96_009760 [Linnemannia gamsii]
MIIAPNTVDDLKKRIKIEKAPCFDDIAADELTLWSVSVPVIPANKHNLIDLEDYEAATELAPLNRISKALPTPEKLPEQTPE